jgi:hypothetical protein
VQTLASLFVVLLFLMATSGPAWAGTRPNARVTTDATGVQVGASTSGSPAGVGPAADEHDGDDAQAAGVRTVACSYTPAVSPSGGVTFAATCSNPSAANISFDPMGNARFIIPVPGDPSAPASTVTAATQPVVAPAVLARQAARYLPLPAPIIRTNPAANLDQLVNLPMWVWLAPASWGRRTATAAVPGLTVTVVANPTTVTWRPGDGTVRICRGPGTAYDPARSPGSQQASCAHTYRRSSLGQPAGRYRMTATITWAIRWTASGAISASGSLPPLERSAQTSLRVVEAEALN